MNYQTLGDGASRRYRREALVDRYFANALITRVRDVDVSLRIDSHAHGAVWIQGRKRCPTVVAESIGLAAATGAAGCESKTPGDDMNVPRCAILKPNHVVVVVCEIDIPVGVECNFSSASDRDTCPKNYFLEWGTEDSAGVRTPESHIQVLS